MSYAEFSFLSPLPLSRLYGYDVRPSTKIDPSGSLVERIVHTCTNRLEGELERNEGQGLDGLGDERGGMREVEHDEDGVGKEGVRVLNVSKGLQRV